jgi:hypothetical protein
MDILRCIRISISGLLVGAMAGGIGGLSLGWLLAFSYHRRGPSDPGDAPMMVALGLAIFGACVGAVAGFVSGMIFSVAIGEKVKSR